MQVFRRPYLFLSTLFGLVAMLVVACSGPAPTVESAPTPGTDADSTGQAGEPPAPDPASDAVGGEKTGAESVGGPPQDASSTGASSTATPTPEPEPEETPVSDTESVGFYIRGFSLINRGEYIEAERTFNTVIGLEPAFARGWDGRGQALMLQGKLEEAMFDFDRAIELKPNLDVAYSNRALTRVALDDYDGALRDARRAIEINDESVGAQLVLGRVYARNGDAVTALEWFDLAVETSPLDGATWWWRGRFYRDALGDGDLALENFDMAIQLAPTQAALYVDRALLYIQADVSPELARADLEEALSLSQDPRLPVVIERIENLTEILDERESQTR